jgi:hypothetical protein
MEQTWSPYSGARTLRGFFVDSMPAARDHPAPCPGSQLPLRDHRVRPLKLICTGVIPAQIDRMQRLMALARGECACVRRSAIYRLAVKFVGAIARHSPDPIPGIDQ